MHRIVSGTLAFGKSIVANLFVLFMGGTLPGPQSQDSLQNLVGKEILYAIGKSCARTRHSKSVVK
jgi:hypothetical protein